MKKYRQSSVLYVTILNIFLFSACNKQASFDLGDRKRIPSSLRLLEMRLANGETYQTFVYDQSGRVERALLNGVDRFSLAYNDLDTAPVKFNNYSCQYDQTGRLVAVMGDELNQVNIEYKEQQIDIIQESRPITPSPTPIRKDTLSFILDAQGLPTAARLQPKAIEYAIRYDNNPNPYVSIRKSILPLFMIYSLEDVLPELATLLAGRNLVRIYQTSAGLSNGVELPAIIDYSYRFDHFLYDIPTASSAYGTKSGQYIFIYNE